MRTRSEIATQFSPSEELIGKSRLFLVGIGGAGMSGLAELAIKRGLSVSGVDDFESENVLHLRSLGASVGVKTDPPQLSESDAVVVSDAITLAENSAVLWAKKNGIPVFRRSQLLGFLAKRPTAIAVTGTHGKTTTTGLIATGLISAGLDPQAIVGAVVPAWDSSIWPGQGAFSVVEACEAYDGMHDITANIIVLTNLELDHVDFHGDFDHLRSSVLRFVESMAPGGRLVYCQEDEGAVSVAAEAAKSGIKTIPYTIEDAPEQLALIGRHNRLNAGGARVAMRAALGFDDMKALEGLSQFRGAERRLQVVFDGKWTVLDDYAHTPKEVAASLEAVKKAYHGRRVKVVFQPHLYSRTNGKEAEFAAALSHADFVFITDIYPAREAPMPGVSSAVIAENLTVPGQYIPQRRLAPRKVAALTKPGDVIVAMGAGSIGDFAADLIEEITERPPIGERDQSSARPLRVAVILGGDSSEREVSLHSGEAVVSALREKGMIADKVDLSESLLSGRSLQDFVGPHRYDVAFLAVHGTHAEDGAIQGLLELLGIPYTGSGIQSSALAMDKATTKTLLESIGIRCPRGIVLTSIDQPVDLPVPLVVKPNAEGSTVGVGFVRQKEELIPALEKAFSYGSEVLVEEMIEGMEVSTPVLNGIALPTVEIAPASGVYDFASKYRPGATEEIVPARLPQEVQDTCALIAKRAHNALRCDGATRTDMIVRDGEVFVLEINTLPGLTRTSLLPRSAQSAGISFPDLCESLVCAALKKFEEKAHQAV